jgi:hypothetical protein
LGDPRVASPTMYKGQRGLALSHRTGAKRRPRQSRRPSAAKRIIRAEVPKDTGPIYLQASFFRAAAAGVGDFSLFTVLVYVADEHPTLKTRAGTL